MPLFARRRHTAPDGPTAADVRHAYERGRQDERARRHSHPILGLFIAAAAVVGVGAIYLGWHEGSFSRAGQVVDENLAVAGDRTQLASQDAAQTVAYASDRAQQAGQTLRSNDQQPQQQP